MHCLVMLILMRLFLQGQEGQPPLPPFAFITPSKLPIDLRIYDNQLLERCLVVINQLRQEVHDNWFEDFKNNLYISLKRKLTDFCSFLKHHCIHLRGGVTFRAPTCNCGVFRRGECHFSVEFC